MNENKLPIIITVGVLAGSFLLVDLVEGIEGKRKEHSHPEHHSVEYLQHAGAAQMTSGATVTFSTLSILK